MDGELKYLFYIINRLSLWFVTKNHDDNEQNYLDYENYEKDDLDDNDNYDEDYDGNGDDEHIPWISAVSFIFNA